MPSFAELKAKAANATSSGREKMQNMRDRNTSVPMAKTNWDPYSGNPPPPPPPPRSLVNRNTKPQAPLPPPPSRTTSGATSSLSRASSTASTPPLPARATPSPGAPPLLPSRSRGPVPPPPAPRSTGPPLPAGGPPPINRSTRPDAQPRPAAAARPLGPSKAQPEIDWANLSPDDKQVFFDWLDEFFSNFKPPRKAEAGGERQENHEYPSQGPPPPIPAVSKPTSWAHPQGGNRFARLSHPPATQYGSAALDLAHYFSPATEWSGAWYDATDGPTIPPPIVGKKDHTFSCSWRSRGSSKTTSVGVFFSDLSLIWGTVDFTTTNPEDQSQVKRSAVYLPPPKALGRQELIDANETYGETIALYAESFLGSGQCCARGECWDLANEALKYFAAYDYIPKPVPSISRTHGHLIFEGRASNGGREMEGQWRGGDDRVRRGDIAEWRRVRIGMGAAHRGGFFTLGDPDHTAVIVSDAVPSSTPRDGASLSPASLGVLTVVEQSLGKLPERREYDLSCFEEGEMWIYRPIGMQTYLGVSDIAAAPPEGITGLQRL